MKWNPLLCFTILVSVLVGCGDLANGGSKSGGLESTGSSVPVVEASQAPTRPELDWRTDLWNFGNLSVTNHGQALSKYGHRLRRHHHGGGWSLFLRGQGCTDRSGSDSEPGAALSGRAEIRRQAHSGFLEVFYAAYD